MTWSAERTWKSAAEELIGRGRVEGVAAALQQVLEVRFGEVPERIQAVVHRASATPG